MTNIISDGCYGNHIHPKYKKMSLDHALTRFSIIITCQLAGNITQSKTFKSVQYI